MIHRLHAILHACNKALFFVLLCAIAGCTGRMREADAVSTPAAPLWKSDAVSETLRALNAAQSVLERGGRAAEEGVQADRVADYLARQMHAYGVQAAALDYRIRYLSADSAGRVVARPMLVGMVAGRYPLLSDEAVLIYAPLEPGRLATGGQLGPAAWLEMGRLYAEMGRFYRFPVRTVLFVMPVGGDHRAVLRAMQLQSFWPLGKVQAVLMLGAPELDAEVWQEAGLSRTAEVYSIPRAAEEGSAGVIALARRGYAWLLPHVGATEDRMGEEIFLDLP